VCSLAAVRWAGFGVSGGAGYGGATLSKNSMTTVEEGLRSQVRNIEAKYGRRIGAWVDLIRSSGQTKHNEVVALLKSKYGMTHGSAHRVALIARESIAADSEPPKVDPGADPAEQLYAGKKSGLRPLHDRLIVAIQSFGNDIAIAPKKGYLSLRRKKQFAMIQPAATRVDVAIILKGEPTTARLESATTFNALFTHRVRVGTADEVDRQLVGWLRRAYEQAG
jgi:hypothetical protein